MSIAFTASRPGWRRTRASAAFLFAASVFLSAISPASAETLTIDVATRPPLRGVVSLPETGEVTALVVILGGFETGSHAIELIRRPRGVALAGLDYPFELEGKWTAGTLFKRGLELRRALHATRDGMCEFIRQARTFTHSRGPLILVGASFGAPYVMRAARECEKPAALILLHGFGDVAGTLAHRIRPKFEKQLGKTIGGLAARATGTLAWMALGLDDPEEDARRTAHDVPVLWIEAADDDLIPRSARDSVIVAFGDHPRLTRRALPGIHLRPGNLEQVEALFQASLSWLREQGIELHD